MSYYGSRFGGNPLSMFPPVTKWLLGLNVLIFLLDAVLPQIGYYGALWPIGSPMFGVWQFFTYMFMHGGFTHIFFNMIILWMFGMELEQMWGSKRYLYYYLLCGLGAGLIHTVVTLLMGTQAPTVGASGAIMGVMIGFALTYPDRLIFLMFFLPMRAKYAVLVVAGMDLYMGLFGNDDVAHFAHLGGALVGYLLMKFGSNNVPFPGLAGDFGGTGIGGGNNPFTAPRPASRPQQDPQVIDVRYRDVGAAQQSSQRAAIPSMNFGDDQARIDAILDKISVSGYQSLTEDEKAILQEASKKMR